MSNGKQTLGKVIVILGPTSSGKSEVAIKLAKKFNGEIISSDSRQIFRGMDIGTGKVRGSWNRKLGTFISEGIPHYMINIVSPRTDFNVAKFKRRAERIIQDIVRRGKLPIICGGTGFWIQAIVDDVNFPKVKPDWKLRKKLEKYPAIKLFSMLKKIDLVRAKTIDSKNKVRLIRAIEICKSIKRVPSSKSIINVTDEARYKFLQIGLALPKNQLLKNIEKRVKERFRLGMIEEIKKLHSLGLSWKKIQSFGLAYFWIPLYLQNKLSKKELVDQVVQAEKNYAKKQMTWFKRDQRIKWLKSYGEIEQTAKEFVK